MTLLISENDVVDELVHSYQSGRHNVDIHPHEQYTHGDNQGVVDLFAEIKIEEMVQQWVYEVVSEATVRKANGPNEILQQYNRIVDSFFEGTDHQPGRIVFYQLIFIPTDYTLRHVADNYAVYDEEMGSQKDRQGDVRVKNLSLAHSGVQLGGIKITDGISRDIEQELSLVDQALGEELADTFDIVCSD